MSFRPPIRAILGAVLILSAGLVLATPLAAQAPHSVKIIPYAAFYFDSNFDSTFDGDFFDDLSLDEGEGLGLAAAFRITDGFHIELSYSEQETELELDEFLGPTLGIDIDVQYLHAGVTWQWTGGQVQPFVLGSLGVTRLSPRAFDLDADAESRPSAALGGGLEIYFGNHVGLRLHGRVLSTFIDSDEEVFCTRRRCYEYDDTDVLYQLETGAGLIFRF